MRTARRHRTVTIQDGRQTLTAAESVPDDLARIHGGGARQRRDSPTNTDGAGSSVLALLVVRCFHISAEVIMRRCRDGAQAPRQRRSQASSRGSPVWATADAVTSVGIAEHSMLRVRAGFELPPQSSGGAEPAGRVDCVLGGTYVYYWVIPSVSARLSAAHRLVADTLRKDRSMGVKPSVLFVCVHNAGRSQMAAGFLTALAGDAVEVRSAGSAPADEVNPAAVQAMAELGIDIASQTPKILTTDAVEASDVVITMGCGDTCPIFPGKSYRDWVLTDPAGKGVEAVRPIRDEIKSRVEALIAELVPPATKR